MKFLIISALFIISVKGLVAQDFLMSNGTVKTCFGQFFDSGGSDGYYSGNEDKIFTITSEKESATPVLRFVEFSLNGKDWLSVYDGSTTDAVLIGTYSADKTVPPSLKASGGSLTFVFHSENQSTGPGWRANIVCFEGDKKVSRDSLTSAAFRFRYSIEGLKSPKDARLMESNLIESELIVDIKVSYKNSNIWVSADDETYADTIKELINASSEYLGYDIRVEFLGSMRGK